MMTSYENDLASTLKADHNPPSSPRRITIRRKHFVIVGVESHMGTPDVTNVSGVI